MAEEIKMFSPATGRVYKEDSTTVNIGDKIEEFLGQKGMVYIADTAEHTPGTGKCFVSIHTLESTVIAALTADSTAPITGTITGVTIGASIDVRGKFTAIQLTSGSCLAYLGIL